MQIKFKNGGGNLHLIVNSPNEFRGGVVVGETVEARCRSSSISSAVLLCCRSSSTQSGTSFGFRLLPAQSSLIQRWDRKSATQILIKTNWVQSGWDMRERNTELWLQRYHPKQNVVCLFPVYEIMKQVLHSLKFWAGYKSWKLIGLEDFSTFGQQRISHFW